ncbi:MAG: hypothetical protein KBD66_00265 [Candidatus Doudnabacteria bacterium]|nr:hypothetical protein [Candidatus Doudnabacteria bacterium]
MVFRAKTKKRTPSRFTNVAFQSRVKRASAYRRSEQGWKRDIQVFRALVSRVQIWPILCVVAVVAVLSVLTYYPALFHVRRVVVSGLPAGWAAEVQHQTERYLEDARFLFLPGNNLALIDRSGLAAYVTTVNAHVQRVEGVVRRWPHTLEIRAVPRLPAYVWSGLPTEPPVLISNDGKVLPESERGESVPLPLYGSTLATTEVGGQAVGGDLLRALEVVRAEFSFRTGLPTPATVKLIPLVSVAPLPTASGLPPSAAEGLVVPAVTHELRVEVPASGQYQTAAFAVLLDISTSLSDVFDRLRVLLERQPVERKVELYYVDLRFPARAYVCIRSAPCAVAEQGAKDGAVGAAGSLEQ